MRLSRLHLAAAVAIAAVALLVEPAVAAAAGNDVGENLGRLLRHYAAELYAGVIAIVSLVFLINRRYSELRDVPAGGRGGRVAGVQPRPGRKRRPRDRPPDLLARRRSTDV